jgi:hypothetical protein
MFGEALVVFQGFVAGRAYDGHDQKMDGAIAMTSYAFVM